MQILVPDEAERGEGRNKWIPCSCFSTGSSIPPQVLPLISVFAGVDLQCNTEGEHPTWLADERGLVPPGH